MFVVALLAFVLGAEQLSSDANDKSKDHKPISKGQELGITLGIEFGLVTVGVVCYFAFRNSLTGDPSVYPDLTGADDEVDQSSSSSSNSEVAPAKDAEPPGADL